MRKLCKTTDQITAESGEVFSLDYYILKKDISLEGKTVTRFGIEVCKRARRKDGSCYFEYRKIFDVFGTESEAAELLELLARNTVTPVTVKEILEDLLGCSDFADEALMVEAV